MVSYWFTGWRELVLHSLNPKIAFTSDGVASIAAVHAWLLKRIHNQLEWAVQEDVLKSRYRSPVFSHPDGRTTFSSGILRCIPHIEQE
jgi:hypothetical protein